MCQSFRDNCSQTVFHLALWHNPSSTSATVTPRVRNTARSADTNCAAYLEHFTVQDLLLLFQTNHFGRSQTEEFRLIFAQAGLKRIVTKISEMKYANVDQVVNAVLVTILGIGCDKLRNIWLLQ